MTTPIDELPRPFQLRAGDQLADLRGAGVLHPDGTVTTTNPTQQTWPTLDTYAAQLDPDLTILWQRIDT